MKACSWTAAASAIGLALLMLTATAPAASAQQPNQARGKKYIATRAIIVDAPSGALRMPTSEEIQQLVDNLSTLTNRSEEGLRTVPLASGAVAVDLEGRFGSVMLARPNADGSSELRCVTSFDEGAEFLGLVEDPSGV